MKKILLSLLFVNLVVSSTYSQEEINTNQDTQDIPEIYFENTIHDYGNMEYNSDGLCEFTFKNTGKEPLLLTNVKASCGCTTPTWPKEPIKKGKKGTIVVKYNTKIPGAFSKTIRVYSNAKTSPVTLKITGAVSKNVVDEKKTEN
jgi:D-lyxose ketol-isomerase